MSFKADLKKPKNKCYSNTSYNSVYLLKLHCVLNRVMKFYVISLSPAWDANNSSIQCVQSIYTKQYVSCLVTISVAISIVILW